MDTHTTDEYGLPVAPPMAWNVSWMKHAACRGLPIAFFFEGKSTTNVKRAKQTCAVCPVRNACLEYAIVNKEENGVWGGLTAKERKQVAQ